MDLDFDPLTSCPSAVEIFNLTGLSVVGFAIFHVIHDHCGVVIAVANELAHQTIPLYSLAHSTGF